MVCYFSHAIVSFDAAVVSRISLTFHFKSSISVYPKPAMAKAGFAVVVGCFERLFADKDKILCKCRAYIR